MAAKRRTRNEDELANVEALEATFTERIDTARSKSELHKRALHAIEYLVERLYRAVEARQRVTQHSFKLAGQIVDLQFEVEHLTLRYAPLRERCMTDDESNRASIRFVTSELNPAWRNSTDVHELVGWAFLDFLNAQPWKSDVHNEPLELCVEQLRREFLSMLEMQLPDELGTVDESPQQLSSE